jgi:superfamily II DNA or RNA helicase
MKKVKEGKKVLIYSAFLAFGVRKLQELMNAQHIPFVEVTGSLNKTKRAEAVEKYNKDQVKVLFITKAGGEGLDLKGTRYVIILESSWNRPNEEQVIGRAIRFKSHTHLPKAEQRVDVYHLLMVKPPPGTKFLDKVKGLFKRDDKKKGRKRDDDEKEKPSADSMLKQMTEDKDEVNRLFIKRLIPLAIENNKC